MARQAKRQGRTGGATKSDGQELAAEADAQNALTPTRSRPHELPKVLNPLLLAMCVVLAARYDDSLPQTVAY